MGSQVRYQFFYFFRVQQFGRPSKNLISRFRRLIQPAQRVVIDHLEIDLVSNQIPDIVNSVLNHRRSEKKNDSSNERHFSTARAHRSNDNPQAMTDTSSGRPMGRNISGRNTPLFPTSTHFFKPSW